MLLDRAQELMQRQIDQLATDAELAELSRMIAEHTEISDAFAKASTLNSSLCAHFGPKSEITIPAADTTSNLPEFSPLTSQCAQLSVDILQQGRSCMDLDQLLIELGQNQGSDLHIK